MSKKIEPFLPVNLEETHKEHARTLGPRHARALETEEALIQALGERVGFGRMMSAASSLWRQLLAKEGMAGGEFAVGPCIGGLVKCGCAYTASPCIRCDWCCGSGWLTRKVREVQIEKGKSE